MGSNHPLRLTAGGTAGGQAAGGSRAFCFGRPRQERKR